MGRERGGRRRGSEKRVNMGMEMALEWSLVCEMKKDK